MCAYDVFVHLINLCKAGRLNFVVLQEARGGNYKTYIIWNNIFFIQAFIRA